MESRGAENLNEEIETTACCGECSETCDDHEKERIAEFVESGKYRVSNYLQSRCIDGRYDQEENMPGIAIPGADVGQILITFSALNEFKSVFSRFGESFEYDQGDILEIFLNAIGGAENFEFHTDDHAGNKPEEIGCGHAVQIFKTPEDYGLNQKNIDFILDVISGIEDRGARKLVLEGGHKESSVLYIDQGTDYSVYPKLDSESQAFVYHGSLITKRNEKIAQNMVESGIFPDVEEFLSGQSLVGMLSKKLDEVSFAHLNETSLRLAKGLPIYKISFGNEGKFDVSYAGDVG